MNFDLLFNIIKLAAAAASLSGVKQAAAFEEIFKLAAGGYQKIMQTPIDVALIPEIEKLD